MNHGRSSNHRPKQPAAEERTILLQRLKEVVVETGAQVREERLHRGVGYSVRGGRCRVGESDVLILDRDSSVEERIEAVVDFLLGVDLEMLYLEPDVRSLIDRMRRPEGLGNGAGGSSDNG
jgi:hypothetical protein